MPDRPPPPFDGFTRIRHPGRAIRGKRRLFRYPQRLLRRETRARQQEEKEDAPWDKEERREVEGGGREQRLRLERSWKVLNGRGRENSDHNVILTEITPPRSPRDNKFATLLAGPRIV